MFESLEAFRAHCREPTMPLAQCPICSKIPEHCSKDDADPPCQIDKLGDFIERDVRRCPTCRRLYFYDLTCYGNDIYTGNDSTWSLDRCSVEVLFDLKWCVKKRLPNRDVSWIHSDRFFPTHVLVRFGSGSWGALDRNNQLVVLRSHDALVKLIGSDPPRVCADLELAKRYALFVEALEKPTDQRPEYFEHIRFRDELSAEERQRINEARAATGLAEMVDPKGWLDMRPIAEHVGDRVKVQFWATARRRLIRRLLTIQLNGHLVREDTVIAENLPMGH